MARAIDMRRLLRDIAVFTGEVPGFDPSRAPDDPVELFTDWLVEAVRAGVPEPHAMTLATVDTDGNPAARVLILKNVDAGGFQFATDADSAKGRHLAARPTAALTFYWSPLARQVRVRGPVTREDAERSAADFRGRSLGARAEALVGRQSQPLTDLTERDTAVQESLHRLEADPDLVAPNWALYTLRPDAVEFWQGDRERRHTRLVYRRSGEGWTTRLLWP